MNLASKLPGIGVTIFTTMTLLADRHDAINLSQGFPDFDPPQELIFLVTEHMKKGANQYAPMQGTLRLREEIAQKIRILYGAEYDPASEITVTSGATEAIFDALSATVHPGDEVIFFEPAFDVYIPGILLNRGIPKPIPLSCPGYRIDWNMVRDAIGPRTKMLIINSPHNPTGSILDESDIDALCEIVSDTGIFILSDEVYEHILFDGNTHLSISTRPELKERGFVISSFGKTYHTTGWKIGYCAAPRALSKEFQRIHQYVTFASNTPIQEAYADFIGKKEYYLSLASFYQEKRDLFIRLLADSRFEPLPCGGTYFIMLKYDQISDEADTEFAVRLTREYKVAAIPPSVFYTDRTDHRVLRFCFAKKDETLIRAAERLCKI